MSRTDIFATGDAAERTVAMLMETPYSEAHKNKNMRDRYFFDLTVFLYPEQDNYNKEQYEQVTIEVKNDIFALKSGNIAIEMFNPKANRPSGLTVSKADVWVFVVGKEAWAASAKELKAFVEKTKPFRVVEVGGDDNAKLLLYKRERIFGTVFTRIDNLPEKERVALIKELKDK